MGRFVDGWELSRTGFDLVKQMNDFLSLLLFSLVSFSHSQPQQLLRLPYCLAGRYQLAVHPVLCCRSFCPLP